MKFLSVCATLAAFTLAAPAYAVSVLTGDVWDVTGLEDSGFSVDGSTLVFTDQTLLGSGDYALNGYFDWVGSGGQFGREYFSGTYFTDDTLNVTGHTQEDASGLVLATYFAAVAPDGLSMVGTWDGSGVPNPVTPGQWQATRSPAAVPLPAALPMLLLGLGGIAALRRRSDA